MQAIRAALRDAARLCQLVQDRYLSASTKTAGDHSEPVTIADYGSQAIICRALQQQYPDDAVIAEESGGQFKQLVSSQKREQVLHLLGHVLGEAVSEAQLLAWLDFGAGRRSRRTWVIDPIDGTKGFLARRHYAIACGLLVDGQIAEGMLAAPGYKAGEGALFYTRADETWRAPLVGGDGQHVTVSARRDVDDFVAVQSYERAHASKSRMGQARELAGLGGARIIELDSMEKYALVACGDADLYMRLPRPGSDYAHKIWDHAAGVALVQAAGGMVTGLDGEALDFSRGETLPNAGMIISNGQQHARVVAAAGRVLHT
ncbi:MAG: 3'(2'),5'-bisphosphate nucleotidase [Chloroflexi bacterium]|nr:3'(2'),5'-bisphosphate nucleotidase [Chloroflexota bacterium]